MFARLKTMLYICINNNSNNTYKDMQEIKLSQQLSVLEIDGKLVYNRARIMKHANAMVKRGVEFDMSSALKHAWRNAHKVMEEYKMKAEDAKVAKAFNRKSRSTCFYEGNFSDSYKPAFFTI
jgi:hypothetical protein